MSSTDDVNALEKYFRHFIIKSIQVIVQSRNGNSYSGECLSNVGARNNMMLNVEDDPEIGASIKRCFDSTFSAKPGDNLTLEIFGKLEKEIPLLEVWHFSIESKNENCTHGNGNDSNGIDPRKTRFLERLCMLLKSVLVTTRLLPAYWNSRNPVHDEEHMCFLIRRDSPVELTRLGNHCQGRCVGTVTALGDDGISLKLYVHYRSQEGIKLIREHFVELLTAKKAEPRKKPEIKTSNIVVKNRPAFANKYMDYDNEDENLEELLGNRGVRMDVGDDDDDDNDDADEEDDDTDISDDEFTSGKAKPISMHIRQPQQTGAGETGGGVTACSPLSSALAGTTPTQRLVLPFSSSNHNADHSQYFSDLKLKTENLDIFSMSGYNSNPLSPSDKLDLSALKEELLVHETTSIEFDDLLQKFESQHHFGIRNGGLRPSSAVGFDLGS